MMADVSEEKTGLADVIAKVLKFVRSTCICIRTKIHSFSKKIPEGAKSAVLAKVKPSAEEEEEKKKERKRRLELKRKREAKRKAVSGVDSTTYEFEAKLKKAATRGAVALFNAVRKAQKAEEDISETSSKKSAKKMDKKDFLTLLNSSGTKKLTIPEAENEKISGKGWSVLKDNYDPAVDEEEDEEEDEDELEDEDEDEEELE
eukprot:m.172473 g.172473  ORF g.172473 m.172473 type:complete len:203 (+) comp15369_c0_seq2:149-757(+)